MLGTCPWSLTPALCVDMFISLRDSNVNDSLLPNMYIECRLLLDYCFSIFKSGMLVESNCCSSILMDMVMCSVNIFSCVVYLPASPQVAAVRWPYNGHY